MAGASTGLHGAGDRLASARDRFLASLPVDRAVVREPILASWWRSREWNVAADRLRLAYLRTPDLESSLARAAEPVLRHLHDQLDGQPISIVLTDSAGLVLLRYTGDHDLERHLDSIMLAPGFSYAEDIVGTNGIGTALESGGPAHVFGHEHYAERLECMACAGVPIKDPVSGKTVGVIDLTCWRRDADPLMISLVQSTAGQINQALGEVSNSRDLRLLQEYTRACRHTGGIVLALGQDVVMLNDHARNALSPVDQAVLISQATEALVRPPAFRRRDGGPAERDGGADVLPAGRAGTAPGRRGAREAALGGRHRRSRCPRRGRRCRCLAWSVTARRGGGPAGRRRRPTSAASG